MIIVRTATKQDLNEIQVLLGKYDNIMQVNSEHLNNYDVALQARLDSGELVGFIWCGLMANKTLGYVDKFVVDPKYANQKVGLLLCQTLTKTLLTLGIKEAIGYIRQDEYHDKSALNALKTVMKTDRVSYTQVSAKRDSVLKMIKESGDSYGF